MKSIATIPRTAYILQIHKNPNQVNGFIKQMIAGDQADVFVHIDKPKYDELHGKIVKSPNVYLLDECIDVIWGDITQVDATILLIKKVIENGKNYDFVCFRSGQDLLVRNGFKEFLFKNQNKIFMTAYHVDRKSYHAAFPNVNWPKSTRRLYSKPFHPIRVCRRALLCLYGLGWNVLPNPNPLPENFSIYSGSNWFCIPIDVAEYIIQFLDKNPWYYNVFKNSLCPDEFFFQTIVMNSPYKDKVVHDHLLYLKWGDTLKSRNHPVNITMDDISLIEGSNQFFARKFDENVDKHIIDYYSSKVSM